MENNVVETGVKGFLKWMRADNPGLYAKVAPVIAQKVPQAFSTYEQSKLQRIRRNGMAGLGDSNTASAWDVSFDPSSLALSSSVQQSLNDSSDVSDVADGGSSTPSITQLISNIVGGISTVYLAKNQADIQKKVTDIQLQRAQAGLPPLPINTSQLGVPTLNVGLSTGTQSLVMWGGLALVGVLVLGAMSRGGARRH